jgi:hypothetical protein
MPIEEISTHQRCSDLLHRLDRSQILLFPPGAAKTVENPGSSGNLFAPYCVAPISMRGGGGVGGEGIQRKLMSAVT